MKTRKKTKSFALALTTRVRATILLIAMLCCATGARAQENLTVNDGTETNEFVPLYGYFADDTQRNQMIYPASQLDEMDGGTITQMVFYIDHVDGSNSIGNWIVSLGETTATTLSGIDPSTPLTQVYSGAMTFNSGETLMTVTFTNGYTYNGGNLLVEFNHPVTASYKHCHFTGVTATGASYCYNSQRNFLPKTTFTYEPADDDCPKPKNLAASNVTARTAELSWESNGTAFILQYKKASDSNWTEKWLEVNEEVNENPYTLTGLAPATEYQVRVQAHSEGCGTDPETGDDIFSDYREISFTTLESCVTPTDLAASKVTAYEATITWTSDADAWQICVNDDEEHLIDVTGEATHTLTGLTPQTTYNMKVRTNCGNEYSNWKTMIFTTACGAVTTFPWSDDFESYEASSQGITFNNPCWVNEHISGSGSYFFEVYSGTAMGGNSTKTLRLHDMTSGTLTKLMLPEMTLPGDNYLFSIDVFRNNSQENYGEGIRVFVSTDGEIEGATELAFISRSYTTSDGNLIPAESASGWYTYELPLGISGTCYIILRGESKYGSATYMDNFAVMQAPSCKKPTDLAASNISAYEATISWTSDAGAWQICVNDDEENLIDVTENPYTLTGLTPETAYTVKVRGNCGADDKSDWSKEVSFTTLAACPAPTGFAVAPNGLTAYTATLTWEGFSDEYQVRYRTPAYVDGVEEGFSSNPAGWSFKTGALNADGTATLSGNSGWNRNTSNGVFDIHICMNMYSTKNYWLITPSMEIQNGYALSFDMAYTAYSGTRATPALNCPTHRFAVLISTDDMQHWTILREWNNSGSEYVLDQVSTSGENSGNIDLSAYAGQTAYIAFFGHSEVTSYDNNFHFDNVAIGTPVPAGEMQYARNITEQTVTLQGLLADCKYEAWLQGDCGSEGSSTEVGPISFTTNDTFMLKDGIDLSASELTNYEGQQCDVTYTREFTSGTTSTVCLPFAYTKQGTEGSFYEFTNITKEGDEYVATMTEPVSTTLTANTPYLFTPATGSVTFTGTIASVPATFVAGETANDGWTFKGTFATIEWAEAPVGTYGFSAQSIDGISKGQFVKVGNYVRIKPMRCYLENESFAGARGANRAAGQLPETIKVRLVSTSGEITAIGSLSTKTGEVTLDKDAWYTIDGRRIAGKPTVKGVYVNNGNKVIIK